MPWIKCLGGGGGKARRGKSLTVSQPVHLLVKTEFEPQCHVFRTKQLRRPRPCHLCHQAMIKQASCCRVCEYTCHKTCEDKLFDTLRTVSTGFESKIHLINGDLTQDDMALSESDRNTLVNEVNIILHNASNVKFMEKMGVALKVNVLGTKTMLDLAKQCKHIEGFMYMSTAYSHCYQKNIKEEAYPSPADMKTVHQLIATDSATPTGISEDARSTVLGKFPTTYTFTKAIAEGLVNDTGKEVSFPCIIYRPAIVISSWKEPVRGWCGNVNGPALLFIGAGLGIVHTSLGGDTTFDMIPVDMSINALLVIIWDAIKKSKRAPGTHVYNYGSSVESPVSVKHFQKYVEAADGEMREPSIYAMWKHFVIYTNCTWYFMILHSLFHYIPAIIVDLYLWVCGKKPMAISTLNKVSKNHKLLLYFISGEWKIDISNVNKAIDKLNSIDRELFFCDVRKLDWKDYGSTYWLGLRKYVLKEPISTLPAARRKLRIFRMAHYTIKYAVMLFIGYIIAVFLGLL